jgi:hypothetical protein
MKIFTLDALFEWAKEWIFGPEVRDCLAAKDFSGQAAPSSRRKGPHRRTNLGAVFAPNYARDYARGGGDYAEPQYGRAGFKLV